MIVTHTDSCFLIIEKNERDPITTDRPDTEFNRFRPSKASSSYLECPSFY